MLSRQSCHVHYQQSPMCMGVNAERETTAQLPTPQPGVDPCWGVSIAQRRLRSGNEGSVQEQRRFAAVLQSKDGELERGARSPRPQYVPAP